MSYVDYSLRDGVAVLAFANPPVNSLSHALRQELVDGLDRAQMRNMADALRNKWGSGIVVLAAAGDSGVAIVSAVTKDLTQKVHAGKLAGAVAQAVGGKGGGRPDLAEAGGKDAAALPAALDQVYASVEGML